MNFSQNSTKNPEEFGYHFIISYYALAKGKNDSLYLEFKESRFNLLYYRKSYKACLLPVYAAQVWSP